MKHSTLTLSAAFAGVLLLGAAPVRAEGGHDHDPKEGHTRDQSGEDRHAHGGKTHGAHGAKPHQAPDTAEDAASVDAHERIASLHKRLGEMERELAEGKLEGMHDHFDAIAASVQGLDKAAGLSADTRKRVKGYVKNVLKLSDKVHHAADGNKPEQAKQDFAKLKAQVDVLGRQFTHSHKADAAHPPHPKDQGHSHEEK